jgi:transmembrane sensor
MLKWIFSRRERLRLKASDWLSRLQSGMDEADREEFRRWYEADPAHADAFDRIRSRYGGTGLLTGTDFVRAHRFPTPEPRALRRRGHALAAGAAAFVVVAGAILLGRPEGLMPSAEAQILLYATHVGEIREVPLPDGTRMTLDTSTSVAVVMGRDLRHVRLRGGRARFAVAPDGRPFLIEAGPGRVSGSNARFDVALGRRGAAVHALEGVVSVMPPGAASGNRKILLAPGQAVAIPAASGGVEALPSSGSATKWPEGMLEFDNTPLDAAVAEANRYSETRISLAQPSLAQLRVSGTFRAGDLEGLARSLGTAFGLHVERRGARQLVLTEVGSGRRAGDPRKKKGG